MEDEHEDNFTVNEIDVDERDVDEHDVDEHDVDNTNEILEYAIEAEEEPDFEQHINNYTLQIPEITYQITSIDTKSVSDHSISQFPDTAYAEFMKLVSTHHFSNSTGNDILKWFQKNYLRENVVLPANTTQGHEFVNSMNIEHLLYLKTKILEYEDEEYYLHHHDDNDGHHERVYGEQWSGMWWERTQNSLGTSVKKILSIILYSDATTLDHLGKSSEHPIYLSLGNIPNWRRNKCDAKALLGFLPKLKQIHNRKDNKRSFASAKRMLYQHCFDIMIKPIYEKLESDLPEDAALTLTYNSSICKRPCHICTITIDKLNKPDLSYSLIELRTPNNMQFILYANICHEYSIHPTKNIFWKFRELNIYSAAVPDCMHHCDLGLFNYQVNFTLKYIQLHCSEEGIDEFNRRLSEIPCFPRLKSFKHGLGNIARFTAAEFRNMMKQLIFVIDGLIIAKHNRKDTFTDSELNSFQEMITDWAKKFLALFVPIVDTEMRYPKLHNWCYHIVASVREYGAINGFSTDTYESLHKYCVKIPYRMSNRRDAISQIVKTDTSPSPFIKHHHRNSLLAERAFDVLIDSLNQYFDMIQDITEDDVEKTIIKWYTNAFIGGTDTIRAKSNYYNLPAFSNIAINMDEREADTYNTFNRLCFAKLLMLFSLKIPGHEEQELALIQWYDFKNNNSHKLLKYDCPHMKSISTFTVIAVDSIVEQVHIVPQFGKSNEYFINLFMF
ncbi:unnamed protein product [Rhizophagus irregularis]|nr:unnamed protein product [Rhizophagus irregularis]